VSQHGGALGVDVLRVIFLSRALVSAEPAQEWRKATSSEFSFIP